MNSVEDTTNTQTIVARKFLLKHSFRAGAIIWVKDRKTNKDYFVVLKSHSRPSKGVQLPGGRVEKLENVANTVVREVKEETGLSTSILCPLGTIYINNPTKNYSRLETYYIVRPTKTLDIRSRWRHTDKDRSKQKMEVWMMPVDGDITTLNSGQDLAVKMFRQWLNEHAQLNDLKGVDLYQEAIEEAKITVVVDNSFTPRYNNNNNLNNSDPDEVSRQEKLNSDSSLKKPVTNNKYYRNYDRNSNNNKRR